MGCPYIIGDHIVSGEYYIHSQFDHVINFINKERMLFLVDNSVGAGPISIVVSGVKLPKISRLKITKKFISTNLFKFPKDGSSSYNSALKFTDINWQQLPQNILWWRQALLKLAHPLSLAFLLEKKRLSNFKSSFEKNFAVRMLAGMDALLNHNLALGARTIKGCGFGLTPSGDDFLAGVLFGLNFINNNFGNHIKKNINKINELYRESLGESIMSNTFLHLAKNGWAHEKLKSLLRALVGSNLAEISKYTEILLKTGETSGADLAVGLLVILEAELRIED